MHGNSQPEDAASSEYGVSMTAKPHVALVAIGADNWRKAAGLVVKPGQEQFVAPVSYYLCLAHYGDDWTPLGIEVDGAIVGHVMWAVDEDDSVWLGGLVIDAAHQSKGVGRGAVLRFIDRFSNDGNADIALSYSPGNTAAKKLYRSIGFVETGEIAEDELVARYRTGGQAQ